MCQCTFIWYLWKNNFQLLQTMPRFAAFFDSFMLSITEFSGQRNRPTENAETSMEGAARRPHTTPTAHLSPHSPMTASFPSCTKASSITPAPRPAAATATRGAPPGPTPLDWATAATRSATAHGETVFAVCRLVENCQIDANFLKGEPRKPITSKPDIPFAANFIHNCVFPFMYNSIEYHTCTTAGNSNSQLCYPTWTSPSA